MKEREERGVGLDVAGLGELTTGLVNPTTQLFLSACASSKEGILPTASEEKAVGLLVILTPMVSILLWTFMAVARTRDDNRWRRTTMPSNSGPSIKR